MELNSRNKYLLSTLVEYKAYLIVPTIAGMFLALVYVFVFRSQSWTTRQRLLVRDDLLGQSFKPGQFSSFDTMKSRQETILDIARNPDVIRNTLSELGPASQSWFSSADGYPDNKTIEQFQGQVGLSAPNGAEFGTTEVVVLSVKAANASRSIDLITKLLDEIERQVEKVRNSQLQSMETELQAARDNAKQSLQESIDQLRDMELMLGIDSVTMANMTSAMPGDNSIKTETLQILAERRGFEAQLESLRTSYNTLQEAQANPLLIVSSASTFFREHVKLNELAKSLVDSQKSYAMVAGKYQAAHPLRQSTAEQVEIVTAQVAEELTLLTASVNSQISELEKRILRLDDLINQNHQRLRTLSEKRGDHLAINAEITKRTETLNLYEASLKNIQAYHNGNGSPVWVTRIGDPQPASQPDGLSKRATILAGGFLGFLFGTGLIILLAPPFKDRDSEQASATNRNEPSHQDSSQNENDRPTNRPRKSTLTPEPSFSTSFASLETASVQMKENASSRPPMNVPEREPIHVEASSVTIPDVSEDRLSHYIEKLSNQKTPSRKPIPEVSELEQVRKESARLNFETAQNEANKAEEVLAELRANRPIQTDPWAQLKALSPHVSHQGGSTLPTGNAKLPSIVDEISLHQEISQMQRFVGKPEVLDPIQQSFRQKNPFLANSEFSSRQPNIVPNATNAGNVSTSVPDQVKSISDSIIGLVPSTSR